MGKLSEESRASEKMSGEAREASFKKVLHWTKKNKFLGKLKTPNVIVIVKHSPRGAVH